MTQTLEHSRNKLSNELSMRLARAPLELLGIYMSKFVQQSSYVFINHQVCELSYFEIASQEYSH